MDRINIYFFYFNINELKVIKKYLTMIYYKTRLKPTSRGQTNSQFRDIKPKKRKNVCLNV